jgi:plastocyanin
MPRNSNASNVSRRQFLAVASSVAAVSSLAVAKASSLEPPSPEDPSVVIDITTSPISYSVAGHHAYRLNADPGDRVTWTAKTTGPKHHLAILFLKETPLVDASNRPMYAVHGSEIDEAGSGIGGTIDNDALGTYEYYVAVFDNATNLTYTDDPKIIVGTGNAEAQINLARGDLKRAEAQLSSKPKQQKQIESIEHELEHLVNDLNDSK